MESQYFGSVYAKDGKLLYRSSPHSTRAICVQECVAMRPRTRRVSTTRASFCQAPGSIGGEWHDTGKDVQWHDVPATANA